MIFRFKMLSDENDDFFRDYEVPCDMSLLDFHKFICGDLKYDCTAMTSLFLADNHWNKLREFTMADMGFDGVSDDGTEPTPMENVRLSQIVHNNLDRLIYQFDMFEDRAYFLEMTEAKKRMQGHEYPAVVDSCGDIPDQFEIRGNSGVNSLFDEIMADFGDFQGDDDYDDE